MRQAGGQLSQRGEPLRPAHLCLSLLEIFVCFAELPDGGLGLKSLLAVGLGELIAEERNHRAPRHTQYQLAHLFRNDFLVMQTYVSEPVKVDGARGQGRKHGSPQTEISGGRDDGEEDN